MPKTWLRFLKLIAGLYAYGWGLALMVHASIGIPPWDVLAQGLSVQTKLSYGVCSVIVSLLVLLAWIPLRLKPGLGTVLNAVLIGLFSDTVFPLLPALGSNYFLKFGYFIGGMLLVAFATGLYISSNFGSGPRDGLMVGTQHATRWPFWIVRTIYELTVLSVGWLMGGQVREGTLIFAVCIGYLMQTSMRLFRVPMRKRP